MNILEEILGNKQSYDMYIDKVTELNKLFNDRKPMHEINNPKSLDEEIETVIKIEQICLELIEIVEYLKLNIDTSFRLSTNVYEMEYMKYTIDYDSTHATIKAEKKVKEYETERTFVVKGILKDSEGILQQMEFKVDFLSIELSKYKKKYELAHDIYDALKKKYQFISQTHY